MNLKEQILVGLTVLTLLVACEGTVRYKPVKNLAKQPPLDTVFTVAKKPLIQPKMLQEAFESNGQYKIGSQMANLFGVTIGSITLPSGKLIACDPLHTDEYGIPFTQTFPIGEFPVQASILALGGGERVAMCRILFAEDAVAKWTVASQTGQPVLDMTVEDKPGFTTDAGMAIYVDSLSLKKLPHDSLSSFKTSVYKPIFANERKSWKAGIHVFEGQKAAIITSGMGDGKYASYIGFNAAGRPVQLVTDFRLVKW